ncbi:MAG: Na+/H+ antiporter subunit E [Alphaproteobacteria bacterium]
MDRPSAIGELRASSGLVSLWVVLIFIWIASNSSFAVEPVITGAVIAGVLAYTFGSGSGVWESIRPSPARLYHFIRYTGSFAVELVRANITMLRYVYSPRIDIAPGIVEIKTRLKSPIGRLALANSIALTPGSLVIDIKGDTLLIHWLDVKTAAPDEAAATIAGPFEEHLEKAFG